MFHDIPYTTNADPESDLYKKRKKKRTLWQNFLYWFFTNSKPLISNMEITF